MDITQVIYAVVCVAVGMALVRYTPACAGSVVVYVSSRHRPNHPLLVHVVVTTSVEVGEVVVVLSLQPNQPGVLQVVEGIDVVVTSVVVVLEGLVVEVPSLHPHHPGVLQVSVLVLVDVLKDVDDEVAGLV